MRSGNNIHVQQHKTNMINEGWNETQNDAPFVAFYDMRAVTFVRVFKSSPITNWTGGGGGGGKLLLKSL